MTSGAKRGAEFLDEMATRKKESPVLSYDATGWPVIRHEPGAITQICDAQEEVLADRAENLFHIPGRGLVRLFPAPESKTPGLNRPTGALTIHPVEVAHLAELASRCAGHERFDARNGAYKPIDCPRRVAEAFLARGHWPKLPVLNGFIESPTITLEGRLLDKPGYDAETGLFLAFEQIPGYEPPPAKPGKRDAARAKDALQGLFSEFPVVAPEDQTALVAGVITGLVRRSLPSAPMIAITAPTPGTGKSLLAETISIIATGRRPSVVSLGHDDAEMEKRLAGGMLAGDSPFLLDNVERALGGDMLCQTTSQPFLRLRPLGGSGMVSVPTSATMIATGNNLSIVGDLKRRVMLIRLDAKVERPEQRQFTRDHLADVFARRGELIRHALTVTLAYLNAGAPPVDGLAPYGSFEDWNRMVRRPLVWLGLPDPLLASEGLRDQDPDIANMRALFAAWREAFGDRPVLVADVVNAALERGPMSGDLAHPDLYDSLQVVCAEKPNARRLGNWLRVHQNRIVDGLCAEQAGADTKTKSVKWRIRG